MKQLITFGIAFLIIVSSVFSETSVWTVNTDSTTMYIGGTIHILRDQDRPFPAEFDKAYKASDIIVLETDMAELESAEFQQAVVIKGMYTDGRTLKTVLSEATYAELDSIFNENEMPLIMFNNLKPSMVLVTLMMIELSKLGVDQTGIDKFYHGLALMDEKPVEGLETAMEQVDLITSMGEGSEDEFVRYSLRDLEKMEEMFEMVISSWKSGELNKLEDFFLEEVKKAPELYQSIIVDRNNNWIPKIEEYIKTPQTEFVMVGTLHLVGEVGVIEQLKKLGYKVEKFK